MNTHKEHHDDTPAPASRKPGRRLIAAVLVVAAAAGGASFASSGPGLHHRSGHAGPLAMEPAAMDAHIDRMVAQLAGDATPEQRARVTAIAKEAMADLRAGQAQRHQMHGRAHALLMAPVVDRAALEQVRLAHVQQVDASTRRIVEAVADAADVLTPEQRAGFAGHLRQLMP